MKGVRDLLRESDPLLAGPSRREDRERVRQSMLAAAGTAAPRARPIGRRAALGAAAVATIGVAAAGAHLWPASTTLHAAAVRFEIRLAESAPTLDLQPARVAGTDRTIYLQRQAIVTNEDIAAASVVPGATSEEFNVGVRLTPAAGERMRAATAGHIGRPVALMIDGEVVMAPTVRSAISTEALLTGHYTRAEADRIANGMLRR